MHAMENKVDIQCNKIFNLEDSMVMYGVYNSDTLEDLIDTVHKLYNRNYMEWEIIFRTDKQLVQLLLILHRCTTLCS